MKVLNALFLLMLYQMPLHAQQNISGDMAQIMGYFDCQTSAKKPRAGELNGLLKIGAFIPLWLYQKVLSEQISAVCEFDQSCSYFAIHAIEDAGIFRGVLLTADRLTRCNGQAQVETESYLINHVSGKTIDEPWMYRLKD